MSAKAANRDQRELKGGRAPLLAGGLAAILGSACCLGPLLLITLGFSGAWIGNLTVFEPYRPFFIAVATGALFLAWRRIWRPATSCAPGGVCAQPKVGRSYKVMFAAVVMLVLIALAFPYVAPWFY